MPLSLETKIRTLVEGFPDFVRTFGDTPAFNDRQLASHRETLALRSQLGSAGAAANSRAFSDSLRNTLELWRMNSRGALLISADDFHASLKRSAEDVAALESAALEDDALQHAVIAGKLWTVIERLRLTETRAQLVTSTKSLHHLLPSLVVPMDRQFTGAFFRWNNQAWQVTQERSFKTAFGVFANIARQVKPSQYIGSGWNTSATKVLDNALVSFCRRHELDKASRDKAILARATELGLLGDLASKAGKRKT